MTSIHILIYFVMRNANVQYNVLYALIVIVILNVYDPVIVVVTFVDRTRWLQFSCTYIILEFCAKTFLHIYYNNSSYF